MKFDPWVISSISDSISSAAFWIRLQNYVRKLLYNFTNESSESSWPNPLFSQKISRITQIKNGFQMWKKKKSNCHSSKDLLQIQLSPSLLLLQLCGKNWPYSLCSLRDQKVTPAYYYAYYVIGNVPFFLAAVGNRGWNRSHIRTTSYT